MYGQHTPLHRHGAGSSSRAEPEASGYLRRLSLVLNAVDCFNNYMLAQWRRCSSGSYAIYPTNSKLPCYTVSAAGPWKTPAPIIELDVIPSPSLADKLALRGACVGASSVGPS